MLNPALLPPLLRAARGALFPNNAPHAAPRAVPSPEGQRAIRRRCAESLLELLSSRVKDVVFGPAPPELPPGMGQQHPDGGGEGGDERVRQLEELLDVFGDAYCNRHLMYAVVELLVVRLIPEMGEKGVRDLLAERLG